MKRIYILPIMLLFSLLSTINGNTLNEPADSCSPTFKEIYNFNVGDVFQYEETETYSAGGAYPTTETTRKYTINTIVTDGDTIRYHVSGIVRIDQYCAGMTGSELWCESVNWDRSVASEYNRILEYIDTLGNPLNKCHGDTVYDIFPEEWLWAAAYEGYSNVFTTVQVKDVGGNKSKWFGDEMNTFGEYNDSIVEIYPAPWFYMVYASGLGETTRYFWAGEYSMSLRLEGYIKNGIVHGTVAPDDVLLDIELAADEVDFNIYPNPGKGIFEVESNVPKNDLLLIVYDQFGKQLKVISDMDDHIDLSSLQKGVYYVKIFSGKKSTVKQVFLN